MAGAGVAMFYLKQTEGVQRARVQASGLVQEQQQQQQQADEGRQAAHSNEDLVWVAKLRILLMPGEYMMLSKASSAKVRQAP